MASHHDFLSVRPTVNVEFKRIVLCRGPETRLTSRATGSMAVPSRLPGTERLGVGTWSSTRQTFTDWHYICQPKGLISCKKMPIHLQALVALSPLRFPRKSGNVLCPGATMVSARAPFQFPVIRAGSAVSQRLSAMCDGPSRVEPKPRLASWLLQQRVSWHDRASRQIFRPYLAMPGTRSTGTRKH